MSQGVVRELSEFLANQIAAGEVVLRPASVVKELMENAVDAKAEVIIVNIKEGGIDMIQVVDDGCGMCFDDAKMAFNRHATSKIKSVDDLFAIRTFGFRGEALPSIASISHVNLKSRMESSETGVEVDISGGALNHHQEAVAAKGTQIVVKNLFYNIPARRKFLKSARAEQRHIEAEFVRVALCYPRISFFLHSDGKCIYNLPSSNLRKRVDYIAGKNTGSGLMELHVDTSIVEIKGYVGHPKGAKKSASHFMFVNGRYFSSRALHKAVASAYQNLLSSTDTLPSYFLYFDIAPERIDVNVSPGKSEVKFDDEQSIWQILSSAVRESLGRNGVVPMIDFEAGDLMDISIGERDESSQDTYTPQIDVNPIFNPFDESFSFSRAVGGDGDSFRNSIRSESYVAEGPSEYSSTDFVIEKSETIEFESTAVHSIMSDIPSEFQSSFTESTQQEASFTSMEFSDQSYVDISFDQEPSSTSNPQVEIKEFFMIGAKYIACKVDGVLNVVDTSRALYRIGYDRIITHIENNDTQAAPSQRLLFPRSVTLAMGDYPIIIDNRALLEKAGIHFDSDDATLSIEITSIPTDLKDQDTDYLIEEIIGMLKDETMDQLRASTHERVARSIARVGARNAKPLTHEEAQYTLEELYKSTQRNFTPDGQPTIVTLTMDELTLKFRR